MCKAEDSSNEGIAHQTCEICFWAPCVETHAGFRDTPSTECLVRHGLLISLQLPMHSPTEGPGNNADRGEGVAMELPLPKVGNQQEIRLHW